MLRVQFSPAHQRKIMEARPNKFEEILGQWAANDIPAQEAAK